MEPISIDIDAVRRERALADSLSIKCQYIDALVEQILQLQKENEELKKNETLDDG